MVVTANALRTALGGFQLHSANPGAGGAANKSSAGMKAPAWTVVTGNGDFGLAAPITFTGCAPNGAITWISVWSNTSGSGVWYGNFQLTEDLTADSSGNYVLQTFPIDGMSP
ncbi:hypothetical protein BCA37_10810 [Mycobacterium sp. djl-10]|nr:hypothetical protein BCA37_10810 [Mycobacterium sp. djl-10]